MQIVDILKAAQQQNSSDIHIVPGNPVMLRIDGCLLYTSDAADEL